MKEDYEDNRAVETTPDEIQLTKIETILMVGVIGCLLFATWELAHRLEEYWLHEWVQADEFTRKRIIYYGIAFAMSIVSILVTSRLAFSKRRFVNTVIQAFLWYGTLLLLSSIAIFVFDCLPEIFAGFAGAGVFIAAIYIVQTKYFTQERMIRNRLDKGRCFSCGASLASGASYCSKCGTQVGRNCPGCDALVKLMDRHCWQCGQEIRNEDLSKTISS